MKNWEAYIFYLLVCPVLKGSFPFQWHLNKKPCIHHIYCLRIIFIACSYIHPTRSVTACLLVINKNKIELRWITMCLSQSEWSLPTTGSSISFLPSAFRLRSLHDLSRVSSYGLLRELAVENECISARAVMGWYPSRSHTLCFLVWADHPSVFLVECTGEKCKTGKKVFS